MQGRFKKNQRQTLAGSVRREDLGSAGSLPAVFGSLAKQEHRRQAADDCRLAACAPQKQPFPLWVLKMYTQLGAACFSSFHQYRQHGEQNGH